QPSKLSVIARRRGCAPASIFFARASCWARNSAWRRRPLKRKTQISSGSYSMDAGMLTIYWREAGSTYRTLVLFMTIECLAHDIVSVSPGEQETIEGDRRPQLFTRKRRSDEISLGLGGNASFGESRSVGKALWRR